MFHWEGKRTQDRKIESKKGASLVIVVCVSAFLVAFALAMVYTAGMMLAQANKRLKQERCYQLARSFAQVLDEGLALYDSPQEAIDDNAKDSFYWFACKFLELKIYQNYNPDWPDTVYYYTAGDSPAGEGHGEIEIALYKENDWENGKITGTCYYSNDQPDIVTGGGGVAHYTFTVQVTARLDGVSYTYSTVYNQRAVYAPDVVAFKDKDGNRVYWKEQKWENSAGEQYVPDDPNTDAFTYEIIPFQSESELDKLTGCWFENVIPEKGESGASGGEEIEP